MKRNAIIFIGAFLLGIIILPLFAFMYIRLGYAPVATAAPPLPLERRLASIALKARISSEAPREAAFPASEANLLEGAKVYKDHCAMCHGLTGQPKTPTAKGMFPPPPQLFQGKGVTDDPVGETYWKTANGIRLTGMPAYRGSLSDVQLWQASQLLANADHLSSAVTQLLAAEPPAKALRD
jgi:mono/diheme cytochrome c family protein